MLIPQRAELVGRYVSDIQEVQERVLTLEVRPGYRFNVFIDRDLVLEQCL